MCFSDTKDKSMRCAAIDIGTVTCRLLVADYCEDQLNELERQCAITNLGIGVDKTGLLQDDAIERVVNQVSKFIKRIDSYKDADHPEIPVVAIATSASRDASNSNLLVDQLKQIGVTLSIIPGSREAELSFKGASHAFQDERLMVLDIGGGSTEVIFGIGGKTIQFSHSFNIGCRRITERFLHDDPPAEAEKAEAFSWIRNAMQPLFQEAEDQGCVVDRIVAVAGTATSIVSIDKNMVVYDSAEVDKTIVPLETVKRIYDDLSVMKLKDRQKVVGLEPARASVIVAGLIILQVVLSLTGKSEFTVSESDILQGVIASYAATD